MQATNTAPMINFAREMSWNPVEASLLGASAIISGDTPLANVRYTLDSYYRAFTAQEPKFCADKNGRVVPCDSPERVRGGRSGGENNPIYGDGQYPGSGSTQKGRYCYDPTTNAPVPEGTPGSLCQDTPPTNSAIGDDVIKRIALFLIALVLLAVAAVSLR